MKFSKIVQISLACATFGLFASAAQASCWDARRELDSAQAGYDQAMAMSQNVVAICGTNNACYYQVAAAVNISTEAVHRARGRVHRECRFGRDDQ